MLLNIFYKKNKKLNVFYGLSSFAHNVENNFQIFFLIH